MSQRRIHHTAEVPRLRQPILLTSLDGFIDAGEAGHAAAMFLRHRWAAKRIGHFDRDTFLDYRARRPTTVIDEGVLRRINYEDIEVLAAPLADAEHDALFLLGPEPDMNWQAFCDAVIDLCRDFRVSQAIGFGAYPAAVSHTRPIRIVSAVNGAGESLEDIGTRVRGYTGPVGAQIVLQDALGRAGVPAIGLWAEVPHYIASNAHPGSVLALVQAVTGALGMDVDTQELSAAAEAHNAQLDEAIAEHPDAGEMVERLEEMMDSTQDAPEIPTGDDLAAEIERFLSEDRE